MSNSTNNPNEGIFGRLDASYRAAGKEDGLRTLCIDFYNFMDQCSEAKVIREMHTEDLSLMVDKLTLFLCMWLGGPKTYREKYSAVGMPEAHKHLVINEAERDAWLLCMDKAVDKQDYSDSFKQYLKTQFRFPAEIIRKTSRSSEANGNV